VVGPVTGYFFNLFRILLLPEISHFCAPTFQHPATGTTGVKFWIGRNTSSINEGC